MQFTSVHALLQKLNTDKLNFFFSNIPASHTSLALLPVPAMEGWCRESGSHRYSHANNDVVKCYGKAGLRVLCTLRRPLSMGSCSLKAYGLKRQCRGEMMPRQSSRRVVLLQGTRSLSRKGREGRNDRRSLTVTLLHSTHILTAGYTTE